MRPTSTLLGLLFGTAGVLSFPWGTRRASRHVGAAYVISNDPGQNTIISSSIAADGTLSFGGVTSAGGRGLHGNNSAGDVPDGLFSQGAIEVSGNHVFTINARSNTASMFSIHPKNPSRLTMVGAPVSTGGEFPMSIGVSKATGMVCVLNGGAVANVNCFTPDPSLGLMTVEGSLRTFGFNQTTPPAGPAGTTSHVLFNTDGTKLTASIKGVPPTPGFLATWDIVNGTLSQDFVKSTPSNGGLLPFGMSNIPGQNAIINADAGVGFVIYNFDQSPATSSVVPIQGQMATCCKCSGLREAEVSNTILRFSGTSFSNVTNSFFLTDAGTSQITEVAVDKNLNGTIIKQYPQAVNSTTLDSQVGSTAGKDFLYVLSAGKTTINVLALPGQGQATKLQDFDVAEATRGAKVTAANIQGMALFLR